MAKALQLREAGLTYEQIASQLGVSYAQAYKDVNEALENTYREPADSLREVESRRLDALQRALWPKAMQGQLGAIDRLIRIQERVYRGGR